ncbi:thiosulfate oxidation carrier complex protein SoxZ [Sabulicella rubraurantiaca]|uniref:thiosulfate oxidation carrier complex protein SoxZ n=1 Tax=Sabulicella rubraurantiaca TaxID=2811429 RepID=UPI001A97D209|nr:thiosulfate oxidation carrier complex protein SoxZ [Sabulicella rubraurantiaca]
MSGSFGTPRIRAPRTARPGEAVEIRTLIEHPMETGLRQEGGRTVPRDFLNRLVVRVNGEVALEAELRNGTSTNPYHVFFLKLDRTSEIEFVWTDEGGRFARATARIAVA